MESLEKIAMVVTSQISFLLFLNFNWFHVENLRVGECSIERDVCVVYFLSSFQRNKGSRVLAAYLSTGVLSLLRSVEWSQKRLAFNWRKASGFPLKLVGVEGLPCLQLVRPDHAISEKSSST